MDNTHHQRVHPSGQPLQLVLFTTTRPHADRHRFTSARRLQCSSFTLALRNNRYERQPTGGFNQHFQLCSPKYRSPRRLSGNADLSFPYVYLASGSLITSSEWQTHTTMSSDHLHILIGLQTIATSSPARHRTYIKLKKADWTGYRQELERKLSSRHLPTDCQKDEKLFRATLLKADSHHIHIVRRKLYTHQVPAEILSIMEERDDLCKQDPASPRLSTMNDGITKAPTNHKRRQCREFVEIIDHRTDSTKLWATIIGIDGKSQ